jgi:hypothetical protein
MGKDVELSAFTMHLKEIDVVEPIRAENICERYRFDVDSANKIMAVPWIERVPVTLWAINRQSLNATRITNRLPDGLDVV